MPLRESSLDQQESIEEQYDAADRVFTKLSKEMHLPFLEVKLYRKFFLERRDEEHLQSTYMIVNALLDHKRLTLATMQLVQEREQTMKRIHVLGQEYARGTRSTVEVQTMVLQLLYILQQSTLKVVEAVQSWREPLTRPYPFMWNNVNYFYKIVSDCQAIDSSDLSSVLPLKLAAHPLCSNLSSLSLFGGSRSRPQSATFPLKKQYIRNTPPDMQVRLQRAESVVYSEHGLQDRLLRELHAISGGGAFVPLLNLSTLIPNCVTGIRLTNKKWDARYRSALSQTAKRLGGTAPPPFDPDNSTSRHDDDPGDECSTSEQQQQQPVPPPRLPPDGDTPATTTSHTPRSPRATESREPTPREPASPGTAGTEASSSSSSYNDDTPRTSS